MIHTRNYIRVFAYPTFQLSQEEIEDLLSDFLPYADIVKLKNSHTPADGLRAPDDAIFIQLAKESDAEYLVSGDKDISDFGETSQVGIIITPARLLEIHNIG